MRYIIIEYSNGYCGCDVQEYCIFKKDVPDSIIDSYCSERLQEYAKNYMFAAKEYDSNFKEEDEESYYNNCSYNWTEVNPKSNEDFDNDEWTEVNLDFF